MMSMILSMAGQVLLVAVLLALLAGRFVQDGRRLKMIVTAGLVLCMLLPVNGLTVAQWLRSVVGDLSLLMLVILFNILAQRMLKLNIISVLSLSVLLRGIALTGVVFYPLALGMGAIDPYQFGYAPLGMGLLLVMVSLYCWFRGMRDLAVVVLLPLLGFNFHLLESTNLWDYLLDPALFIYAAVQSLLNMRVVHLSKESSR